MRGMICGMVAPAWPMEAARLAHLDGVVSHDNNGVYGEIFSHAHILAFIRQENTRASGGGIGIHTEAQPVCGSSRVL